MPQEAPVKFSKGLLSDETSGQHGKALRCRKYALLFKNLTSPALSRLPPAGLVVLGMLCFYWGEAQVKQLNKDWDSLLSQTLLYMPSVLHIVYTNMLATVYKTVAQSLTEYGE